MPAAPGVPPWLWLQLIAKSLPLDEINGMREIFLEIDKDKSGTITVDEFSDALKRKGVMGLTEGDVTKMIAVGARETRGTRCSMPDSGYIAWNPGYLQGWSRFVTVLGGDPGRASLAYGILAVPANKTNFPDGHQWSCCR